MSQPEQRRECLHKTATGCWLTVSGNCCACSDLRAHSPTYARYIDGVGFVQRGSRWQAYCWRCKTFWDNRVEASQYEQRDTQIPERPDVTAFIARWAEFNQGYRNITHSDGRQERIVVLGEKCKDIMPGVMPRTLEEMRLGRVTSDSTSYDGVHIDPSPPATNENEPSQSLEEVLDSLLAEDDDPASPPTSLLFASNYVDVATELTGMLRTNNSSENPAQPSTIPQQEQQQQQVQTGLSERLARLWGSREEVQSEEYVSPITNMFNRAWRRHQNFEEMRRAQLAAPHVNEPHHPALAQLAADTISQQQQWEIIQQSRASSQQQQEQAPIIPTPHIVNSSESEVETSSDEDAEGRGLDAPGRPPPLPESQLMVKLECKICLQQRANIICMPCGHLNMCQWCADQAMPVRENDPTRLQGERRCPLCRKKVKRRMNVFIS